MLCLLRELGHWKYFSHDKRKLTNGREIEVSQGEKIIF
jgi:hypothetical protein